MRRSNNFWLSSAAALAAISAMTAPALAADPAGVWMSDNGKGAIEIKDCGGKMCGHLVWIKDPADKSRGCRKQIIGDAAPAGNGRWDGGWVYSPERGRRYDVELKPLNDGTLRVVGYAGTKLFSKTMIWTKAPAGLVRCDVTEAAAKPQPEAPKAATPTTVVAAKAAETAPVETKAKQSVTTEKTAAPETIRSPSVALMTKPAPPPATEAPKPDVVPAPSVSAPAPVASAPAAAEPKVSSNEDTEQDDDNAKAPKEDLLEKIAGMEFGDDYGLKKTGNGKCRLKLPYVTIDVTCEK